MAPLDGLRYGEAIDSSPSRSARAERTKIVIVGLGMVALAFMYARRLLSSWRRTNEVHSEKLIKWDTRCLFDIVVIGEEPHVAYNRVGLSNFFEHRNVESLYLNPRKWVSWFTVGFDV